MFDTPQDGGIRMAAARVDLSALKDSLRHAPLSPQQVLRSYARTFIWSPVLTGHGSAAEYAQWCESLGLSLPLQAHKPGVEI